MVSEIQNRRGFVKQLMSLSAIGAASSLSIGRCGEFLTLNVGPQSVCAMNNLGHASHPDNDSQLKVEYFGMSCFLITASTGVRIITDPFFSDSQVLHPLINREPADIITISCGNYAHCYVYAVGGMPYVYQITEPAEIMGVKLRGIATQHLEMLEIGRTRPGQNVVMCLEIDGIRLCHLGALGHPLSDEQVRQIGATDVLMAPVGGVSTLHMTGIDQICEQLNPKVIIPMHYRSERCLFPNWATLDDYLQGKSNIINSKGLPERYLSSKALPAKTEILALGYPT